MADPLFTLITVALPGDTGLRMTAKSLALQQQPAPCEWLVVNTAPDEQAMAIPEEYRPESLSVLQLPGGSFNEAVNLALSRAKAHYVWLMDAGDCLSDAYVLRDLGREVQFSMAPDVIYGDTRQQGKIIRSRGASRFLRGLFAPHQAILYRRAVIRDMTYDPAYPVAADYAFALHVLSRTNKLHYYPRLLCDMKQDQSLSGNALLRLDEEYRIRETLLGMHPLRNRFIDVLNRLSLRFGQGRISAR